MTKKKKLVISLLLMQRRTWFIALFQAGLIFSSLFAAWVLRFDFHLPYRRVLIMSAPILILVRLVAIKQFGLLRGWWRYTGVSDALDIVKAVVTGSVVFWVLMRYILNSLAFPRSIYFMEAVLTIGFLAGVRLASRSLIEAAESNLRLSRRVILIGAGFAAEMILREIRRAGSNYYPIGCVDDDQTKQGIRIQGVPVIGTVDNLPRLVADHPVDEVLITVPSATGPQMRRFVDLCEQAGVRFRTVPALKEVIEGQVSVAQLREVKLEDLLGREPTRIDLDSIRERLSGRTILVTGAAGSIGSELCRQILEYHPKQLICVDQSETGMFYLQLQLSGRLGGNRIVYSVADIRDSDRLRSIFMNHSPHIIFHAAAYKHVPLMELNPQEAVENNVFGMLNVHSVAEGAGCEAFVLISSDKAVNPRSVMGATKRICELILSSRPANGMRCVSVRFGNVLGSSGSVVPVLQEQLRKGLPLTITHPDVQRFFMTIREAVALVLQAFAIGLHGDVLVLEMGSPVRIMDLARSLIRLSGRPEEGVPIQFTGLREGEKLTEELFYQTEEIQPTSCKKIKRTKGPVHSWSELHHHLEELRASLAVDGTAPILDKIRWIVREYSHQREPLPEESVPDPGTRTLRQAAGRD